MILTATARQLLEVDDSRRQGEKGFVRVIPPAAAVANLLLCATFEPLLREDPSGFFLRIFLLVESALLVILNLSYFGRRTSVVLVRARIFPVSAAERFVSTVAIEARRKIVAALIFSTAAFLALFFRSNLVAATGAVLTTLLLFFSVECVTSTLALLLLRTTHPSASALALAGAGIVAMIAGLLVFDVQELLAAVPLINWGSAGILAGARGDSAGAFMNAAWIAVAGGAAWILGSRYS